MTLVVPTIPDLPAGHIATVAEMNQLATACTFLLTKPVAHVHDGTGGYAFASPMACWDTKDIDTDGMWNVSNKDRLTIQTNGWYKFWVGVTTNAAATTVELTMKSTSGSNNPLGSGVVSASNYEAATAPTTSASPFTAVGFSGVWPFYLYQNDFLRINGASTGTTFITGVAPSFFALEWVSA